MNLLHSFLELLAFLSGETGIEQRRLIDKSFRLALVASWKYSDSLTSEPPVVLMRGN